MAVVKTAKRPGKGEVRRKMEATPPVLSGPGSASDVLAEVLRAGAQRMLAAAIETEVSAYINEHKHELDDQGRRLVVRNAEGGELEVDVRHPILFENFFDYLKETVER